VPILSSLGAAKASSNLLPELEHAATSGLTHIMLSHFRNGGTLTSQQEGLPLKARGAAVATRLNKAALLPITVLFAAFIGVVLWFREVDFYHLHFFDKGAIVPADIAMRVVFVGILAWLVYAPGAGILALLERRQGGQPVFPLWPAERALVGFGIGIGLWHVVLLILGVAGLYYRVVMVSIGAIVLLASARHFADVCYEGGNSFGRRLTELRRGRGILTAFSAALVTVGAVWLLLVRGLLPGGSPDFFLHYFYYYLEVLQNHGLAPNDVWYHYYYSKGYGLVFFSSLLTDPEAPALVSFCCVAFAALAIASLTARVAPQSLWPACTALLYLLYNLITVAHGPWAEFQGDFQKDHETESALIVLIIWAMWAAGSNRSNACLLMAASSAVAAVIISQPIGIILGLYFALAGGWHFLRKRWIKMRQNIMLAAALGGVVLGIFGLNYVETGLASDQLPELTFWFADWSKMDHWGVIPQFVDNQYLRDVAYRSIALPAGWGNLAVLYDFLRLGILWPVLLAAVWALATFVNNEPHLFVEKLSSRKKPAKTIGLQAEMISRMLAQVASMLITFAVFSALVGRVQTVSVERLTSFNVPMLVLIGMGVCAWVMVQPLRASQQRWLGLGMPALLLCGIFLLWNVVGNWGQRVLLVTSEGLHFLSGEYSLAEAYSRIETGNEGGAINYGVLAAAQHLPPYTPIWALNIYPYCAAPGCLIENRISFIQSPQLDRILVASPTDAKKMLQESARNYFFFQRDLILTDLLPLSRLFAPETIGKFLAIKWTDGSNYLLTWAGPDTKPLEPDFLDAYTTAHKALENATDAEDFLPEFIGLTSQFRTAKWGVVPPFLWQFERPAPPGTIDIVDATYGKSCSRFLLRPPAVNTFREGNATVALNEHCRGLAKCNFQISASRLGDPAQGCGKDFSVTYRCNLGETPVELAVPAEADGRSVTLDCPPKVGIGIFVVRASYGESCRHFRPTPPMVNSYREGNATYAAGEACDGKMDCRFTVSSSILGDPANGCGKDFSLEYRCRPGKSIKTLKLPAEANNEVAALDCREPDARAESH